MSAPPRADFEAVFHEALARAPSDSIVSRSGAIHDRSAAVLKSVKNLYSRVGQPVNRHLRLDRFEFGIACHDASLVSGATQRKTRYVTPRPAASELYHCARTYPSYPSDDLLSHCKIDL